VIRAAAAALVLVLAASGAPAAHPQEAPAPAAPPAGDSKAADGAEARFRWETDLGAAKRAAAKRDLPVVVVVYPPAFPLPAVGKFRREVVDDALTGARLASGFIGLRVEESPGSGFAKDVLGISSAMPPNTYVLTPAGEYAGRIVGYEKKEAWFADLDHIREEALGLAKARRAFEESTKAGNPSGEARLALGTALLVVPDREEEALAFFDGIDAASLDLATRTRMMATRGRIAFRRAMDSLQAEVQGRIEGVDVRDGARLKEALGKAYRELAPKARKTWDGWLETYREALPERIPDALFQKAGFLFRAGMYEDAATSAKELIDKFPDTPAGKLGLGLWNELKGHLPAER